ncbi:MAG: hypothetical protein H0U70_08775 [Tatlockia sp.]|nr:hypothetical protein [Tatlockia sp.]
MTKINRKLEDYTKNHSSKINSNNNVIVLNKQLRGKKAHKRNYFFKEAQASAASKEAIAAAYYRLLIGDRAANISLAHNSQQECLGTISKEIDGFKSAASVRQNYRKLDQSDWVKFGLARILVSSMIFAEGDLTESNWGFDNKGNVVRIDFDRSLDYMSHPITERDVLNLLELQDFKAGDWPRINWGDKNSEENQKFEREKWRYFLKAILPTKDLWLKIASLYDKNALKNPHIEKQIGRLDGLKTLLINLPQFQEFILTNPDSIELICNEFSEYNQHLKNEIKLIDISNIKEQYLEIVDEIKKKKSPSEHKLPILFCNQTNKQLEEEIQNDYKLRNSARTNNFFAKDETEQSSEDFTDFVSSSGLLWL